MVNTTVAQYHCGSVQALSLGGQTLLSVMNLRSGKRSRTKCLPDEAQAPGPELSISSALMAQYSVAARPSVNNSGNHVLQQRRC